MKSILLVMVLILNWVNVAQLLWIAEINRSGYKILGRGGNQDVLADLFLINDNENSIDCGLRSSISLDSTWGDIRFLYRKSIAIDASKVGGNLTAFPVLIDLHDPDLKNVAQANGNDIVFTDSLGNKLDHEIEKFNRDYNSTHSHLVAWVKANLSCIEDTSITLYYGNVSVSNQENPERVWENDFVSVWHLSEISGIRYDSTGNSVDGSPQNFDNDEAVKGKINGADEFDGLNDYIDTYKYPDEVFLKGKKSKTISMWVYTKGFNGGGIFEFGNPGISKAYCSLGTVSKPDLWRADWGGTEYDVFSSKSLNLWVYFVVTYDDDTNNEEDDDDDDKKIKNLKIYGNKQLLLEKKFNLNIQNNLTLKFGKWGKKTFNGSIDEVRVSRAARSAAWIQTEFNNQDDPTRFYTMGPQEVDKNPPQINELGVDDKGEGNPIFYANVSDELTIVKKVTININGSEYDMKQNASDLWIYQSHSVSFGDFIEFQIANASDVHGNWITSKAIKTITLNKDLTPPDVLQWEYFYGTNTFKANVTDSWGEIDKVILNVTSHNLMEIMVPSELLGGNVFTYMNDTLEIPNGPMEFQIFINDTNGNEYTSPLYSSIISINHAPYVENIAINPLFTLSNTSIELSYNYFDDDNHSEAGTEIRWYRNNGTGFFLQKDYNDQTMIPSSALVRNNNWYVTLRPKDGVKFGELVNSSELIGIITIFNTPPDVTIFKNKHPEFILEDQELILENSYYHFFDFDNDSDQSIILWYKDGDLQLEYTNQTNVPAYITQPGETWYYVIQSYDGLNYGTYETSPNLIIESKARINNYNITPINDIEGHYCLEINTTDTRNEIKYVQYVIIYNISKFQITEVVTSPRDRDIWVLDLYLTNYTYPNTELIVKIQVVTELKNYSQNATITSTFMFTFMAEDTAPPRVKNAFYVLNDKFNPTNLTFYAQIEEYGSGVDEIILYYHFEGANLDSNGGVGSFILEEETLWLQKEMKFQNQTGKLAIYSVTVPISQNGTDWKVIYYVSTTDKRGNVNENAFQIDPQQAEKDIIHYHAQEGVTPSPETLLFLFSVIISIAIISVGTSMIYTKYSSKSELRSFDKDLVMKNIHQVSNIDLATALDKHTVGITISTFDENMGPTPLMVTPKSLEKDTGFLFKIAFRSFSNCEFVPGLKDMNQATFNFTHSDKPLVKVLAYSFALDRPQHRGGQENITLSILIYPTYFSIVNQFIDNIVGQIKTIHKLLDSNPEDKRAPLLNMTNIRELISKIILSYLMLYEQ